MIAMMMTVACLAAAPAAADARVAQYGKPLEGLKPTSVASVLASAKDGDIVRLEGKADEVCKAMGCWVTVKQGDASVHVTFEDAGFTIPKNSAGKQVVIEGKVRVKQPDPAEVAHKQGEGAGAAAAAKVSVEAYGAELRTAPPR